MKDFGEIDIELLKRFNQPGPRYTSYPTAPVFSQEFTAADFEKEVADTNRAERFESDFALFSLSFLRKTLLFLRLQYDGDAQPRGDCEYNDYLNAKSKGLCR